jgi:glycosyltransferase involved in cell wall biosynthesis
MSGRTGVLFLNSPSKPGADTWIHALLMRHLDRARFDVHAACTPGAPGAPSASLEVLRAIPDLHVRETDFGPSFIGMSKPKKAMAAVTQGVPMLASLAGLAGYIRKHRIRIIHSTDRPRDALPCVLLGRLVRAKSIVHVHVGAGDWMGGGVRWAFGQADALVAISRFVAGTIVGKGYAAARTHAVLNAIDPAALDPTIDPGPVRRELGLPDGVPVLISVSRLFHWKGQADLLRALALVRKEAPETRLLIVGEEDPWGGPERPNFTAELKALVQELGLGGNVIFTGWRRDVPRLLAASDIYSMPSFEEPFGLVYLEAMAMKRPVVALDNGGTPEVVEHGTTGLLSPPRDAAALAANILTLVRDPALRARMGEAGWRRVQDHFTPARMARDMGQVYDTLARP